MSRSSSSKDQSLPFYMNVDVVQSPRSPGGSTSTPGRSWGSASGVSAYPNVQAIFPPKTQPGYRACHICNEEVLYMRGHVLEHNRRPDGIYYCPICSFRTPLSGENTRHAEEHEKYEKALKRRHDAESSAGKSVKRPSKTSQAQPQTSEAPSSSPSKNRRSGQKLPEASIVTFISSTNVASAAMAAALPPLSHPQDLPAAHQREPEQLDRASLRLPPISDSMRRR
ncbi:hypothetical protein BDZ89DRAFT_1075589 [Hymenopellis radicata]|nr:hypothetical protein BDZ89DRAFT_1075589 [Hymenopellis radicata]